MPNNFLRVIRLHLLYLRISFKYLLAYKASALLTLIFSLIFLVSEILTINVYYKFNDSIGGWDIYSFYILVGSFNIMASFYTFLFEISHDEFAYKIRYGELDSDLIRPMDSLLLTSIQRVDFAALFTLPIPVWLVYTGITHSAIDVKPLTLIYYLWVLLNGAFIFYLVNQLTVNLSFWFTDATNFATLSDQILQLGSRPAVVYPKLVQLGFSFGIPVLLCTNISAEIFQPQFQSQNLLLLLAMTLIFFLIVRSQWLLGLRRYTSASS